MDECLVDNGGCSNLCSNTLGSYSCGCAQGEKLSQDGLTCQGIPLWFLILPPMSHFTHNTIGPLSDETTVFWSVRNGSLRISINDPRNFDPRPTNADHSVKIFFDKNKWKLRNFERLLSAFFCSEYFYRPPRRLISWTILRNHRHRVPCFLFIPFC